MLDNNFTRHGIDGRAFAFGVSASEEQVDFNDYPIASIMSCRADYANMQSEHAVFNGFLANAKYKDPAGREMDLAQIEDALDKVFDHNIVRCALRPLSAVIDETGVDVVDLLKIDVQRAEYDVLLGIDERHWPIIQQISMEVHDERGTQTEGRAGQTLELLVGRGFQTSVREEEIMQGTGRFQIQAYRPKYRKNLRLGPGTAPTADITADAILAWLSQDVPTEKLPRQIQIVTPQYASPTFGGGRP